MAAKKRPKRRKTTAESPAVQKVPQPHGGALNAGGTPGNKGGGRPPKAFKDFLSELRRDPDAQDALEKAAKNPGSPAFRAAWSIAAQYDDERPGEKLDHRFPELPASERQERVLTLLRKAKERKPA